MQKGTFKGPVQSKHPPNVRCLPLLSRRHRTTEPGNDYYRGLTGLYELCVTNVATVQFNFSQPRQVGVARTDANSKETSVPRSTLMILALISLQGPCRRCQLAGIACIFEKPEKKPLNNGGTGIAVEYVHKVFLACAIADLSVQQRRVSHLETQFMTMQGQMLSMQSTLDRILNVIQGAPNAPSSGPSGTIIPHSVILLLC